MKSAVHYQVDEGIAVVEIDNPPINALSRTIRAEFLRRWGAIAEDPTVEAVVVTGRGRVFSGGADIREFVATEQWTEVHLGRICDCLEAFPKLVVMGLNGSAVGGGLEIALAADYRVAHANAMLGLPEVQLGLIPGAGGTQRLPRRIDPKIALEMIVSGQLISAAQALSSGLVDRVIDERAEFGAAVIRHVRELLRMGAPQKRCADLMAPALPAETIADIRKQFAKAARGTTAPEQCIRAVEAASRLSLSEGQELERRIFKECLETPQHRALRHVFFAERAARKAPGVGPEATPRPVARIGIVGSGTMGVGIALAFLAAGFELTLVEVSEETLTRGLERIRKSLQISVERQRLTLAQVEQQLAALRGTVDYRDLAQADLVIEAVFEDYALKEQVFSQIDRVCRPGCLLATNTSTLDLDRIAAHTSRPGDVVGMHFFSPANVMRLVEVVRGARTEADALCTAVDIAKRLGKIPVVVGVGFGFVGNRMMEPYIREAQRLVLEGAAPSQVDRVLTDFGMAMGPLAVLDLAGLDVTYRIRESRRAQIAHDLSYARMGDELYALGRFGQKTGRGYYRYEGRDRRDDPDIIELAARLAEELGIARRPISDIEILERCLYCLIDEGSRVLEEGIAYRPGDCDLIYVNGYGFPSWRGGPMHYAGEIGLRTVLAALDRYRTTLGDYGAMWFEPSKLLRQLAASAVGFEAFGNS
jgi:3-hydroxyacyl-CoA dehydrogenase